MWAYAYEIVGEPIVPDDVFDSVARASDPRIETGHLDQWWRENFQPYTGAWIHGHPELHVLARRYAERGK